MLGRAFRHVARIIHAGCIGSASDASADSGLNRVGHSSGVADRDGRDDRQPDHGPGNCDCPEHASSTRADRHADRRLRVVRADSH
jgi:hypothetical protein